MYIHKSSVESTTKAQLDKVLVNVATATKDIPNLLTPTQQRL